MTVLTSTDGQTGLPRYMPSVMASARRLRRGRLDIVLDDGRRFRIEGPEPGPVAELCVHDPDIFARVIREGHLGFADAYLEGGWSTPNLRAFMDLVYGNTAIADGFAGQSVVRAYERLRAWFRSNSKAQARRNIAHHYDLGNDFYALWLDDTMTYSSALFESGQESLERAQATKYGHLVDRMGAKPGDHILEIGCGWGGFAEYAARERDLKVTAITISPAQHAFASRRIAEAGLADRVDVRLQDYRDVTGRFDGIASIEMFEAVGQRYWPTFFQALRDRLAPGGSATLQIITVDDTRWDQYRRRVDFIQKYIFPGGMLPSPAALRDEVRRAGLAISGSVEFGQSYEQTLMRWHAAFNERWERIANLGFDARFRRMWNFYLTSCAATFDSGNCDVTQITLRHPA